MKQIQRPSMLNERQKSSLIVRILFATVFLLLVLILGVQMWLNYNCFGVRVIGSSMLRTVKEGDFIYADRNTQAKRGDIVIIDVTKYKDHDHLTGDFIIKRLIATEGDRVYCEYGTLYVQYAGQAEYTQIFEGYAFGLTEDFDEVTVGENEIFFLGDNRTVSLDSRRLGCYLKEDIIGTVPEWAVSAKEYTTWWENVRSSVVGFFSGR